MSEYHVTSTDCVKCGKHSYKEGEFFTYVRQNRELKIICYGCYLKCMPLYDRLREHTANVCEKLGYWFITQGTDIRPKRSYAEYTPISITPKAQ